MALLSMEEVSIRFRGPAVLDHVTLRIEPGERIGLVGRNGAGKSTLMRLVAGEIEPDAGQIVRQQGLSVAMLDQEVPRELPGTIFDQVSRGLGPVAELLSAYHAATVAFAKSHTRELQAELDRLQTRLDAEGAWQQHGRVERVLSRMELPADLECDGLSAGMKRRVLLARALAREPDILLLDEPTNHLDVEAIGWLEDFLGRAEQTLVFVTHDREFLKKLATRIVEIDRGRLTSYACDYETYLARKEEWLEAEARQQALFDKRLAQEEAWIRTGIKARRTRNEGRVRALEDLRRVRQARRERQGEVRMQAAEAERSGRLVVEAKDVSFAYGPEKPPVVRELSTLITRGDKVGIIGPNGAGKTTLLRLLLGDLAPRQGAIRHGVRLEAGYFDQLHAQLDEERSLVDNVTDGADRVTIGGKTRHVIGYLEDFLFSPEQSRGPVKNLSGGERNRLLLARLFAKPSNVLVLDEPTNDLDLETLELLEQLVAEFAGTVLVVSHDRAFLNNVVTSTLVFEGDGFVREYAGGYDDWLRQRKPSEAAKPETVAAQPAATEPTESKPATRARKLSYKEQRELESLVERIAELEAQRESLHATLADPAFYQRAGGAIAETKGKLAAVEDELAGAYERWETLEAAK